MTGGGTANGTLVELYTCNGTGAQVWQPQAEGAIAQSAVGQMPRRYGLVNDARTQVQIWACTGGANQSWTAP